MTLNIDEFMELVKKRRSIRRFKPGPPIPDEQVRKILECARWAMSGGNGQPWEFIVVRDQQTRDKIADASLPCRDEQWVIEQTRLEGIMHPQHGRPPESASYRTCQLLIVVLGDRRRFQATALSPMFIPTAGESAAVYVQNIANASNNMQLAITALGYTAQWSTVNRLWEASIKEILGIPAILDVFVIIPIGYPAYTPKNVYRRELDEMIHYEKYDKSKYKTGKEIIEWVRYLREMTAPDYRRAETPESNR